MITGFPRALPEFAKTEFRCPGETCSISRSVHLARLAAGYAKCRHCEHGLGPANSSPNQGETGLHTKSPLGNPRSLFTPEGMRGVYLNEIDRQVAADLAGAFASCLWDTVPQSSPLAPRVDGAGVDDVPVASLLAVPSTCGASGLHYEPTDIEGFRVLPAQSAGPTVVIGHDERPCAPDLITGVALALKRMGCQVIDIGLTTRPSFWFAVEHLQAVGGVHVTGAGCGPAWSGLDLVHRGAVPCSQNGFLDRVQDRFLNGYARSSHRFGSLRLFRASVPYEASFGKHFHALRPLKIAFASPSRAVRDRFLQVFHKLACRLIPVETPVRERAEPGPDAAEINRIAHAVREHGAHLGLFVDDDGQRTLFFDEAGRRIPAAHVAPLIASLLHAEFPGRAIISAGHTLVSSRFPVIECGPSLESCASEMRRHNAVFGAAALDRFWFAEGFPTCDAIVTLARMLQVLSRSDAPFSDVLRSA